MNTNNVPKVFVSYSHDSSSHKEWVYRLACKLVENGIDVILDQWDVRLGANLPAFMEMGLSEADRVLVICTDSYIAKSNQSKGGVGYEKNILSAELLQNQDSAKFIPCVRGVSGVNKTPTCLAGRAYIDFTVDDEFESCFESLLHELHDVQQRPKPQLGQGPIKPSTENASLDKLYQGHSSFGSVSTFIENRRLCVLDDRRFEDGEQIEIVWRNGPQYFLRLIPSQPKTIESLHRLKRDVAHLSPLGWSNFERGTWSMLNDWGAVSFESPNKEAEYEAQMISQVFSDTGEIWGINRHRMRKAKGQHIIRFGAILKDLNSGLQNYLRFASDRLSMEAPMTVIAGFDHIKGLRLALPNRGLSQPCVLGSVVTPAMRVDDLNLNSSELLLPLCQKLWDACDEVYDP